MTEPQPDATWELYGAELATGVVKPTTAPSREMPERVQDPPEGSVPLPQRDTNLARALASNTAVLRVSRMVRDTQPHYRLDFHFRGEASSSSEQEITKQRRPEDFRLGAMIRATNDRKPPSRRYLDVVNYWTNLRQLRRWLTALPRDDQNTTLVVWDCTDFEIPWELFYETVGYPHRESGWLAAEVQVVRWVDVRDLSMDDPEQYSAVESRCVGGVLLLEAPDIVPVANSVRSEYQVGVLAVQMIDLVSQLDMRHNSTPLPFGLVMVRCHQHYDAESGTSRLGDLEYGGFAEFPMDALQHRPAVVFLNACSSAQQISDPYFPDVAHTFAEIFLARGARAVVATLADVSISDSHGFAVDMMSDAKIRDVRIAAFLLDHRRREVARFQRKAVDKRDDSDILSFFRAFAFVYFGHPGTSLRLESQGTGRSG